MMYIMKHSLLLLLTTLLAADMQMLDRRMTDLEDRYDTHIERITPNGSPLITGGWGFYFTGDFIYWTTRLNGFAYAQSGVNPNALTDVEPGKNFNINWGYDPGFKAGIGVNLGYDGWDTYLRYTWLRSSSDATTSANNLRTVMQFEDVSGTPIRAHGSHRHQFNVIDWELGRAYFISPKLILRPFIGLKGSWFDERTIIKFDQINTDLENGRQRWTQHNWGIGIRPGLNTTWHFHDNFSMIGDFALTGHWSHITLKHQSTVEDPDFPLDPTTVVADIRQGFHVVLPVVEYDIGFKWEDWYYDCKFHIAIQVVWENQVWVHNTYLINHSHQNEVFDLSTQGLTAQLRFDF